MISTHLGHLSRENPRVTRWVRSGDAERGLSERIRRAVSEAADGNRMLSRAESVQLPGFIREAAEQLRSEKGPNARIFVDEVAKAATAAALAAVRSVNPPGGRDGAFLSQAEIKALSRRDPELGAMVQAGYLAARGEDPRKAALEFLVQDGARSLLRGDSRFGQRLDVRPGRAERTEVPAGVQAGFDHMYRAEAMDWGSASLKRFPLGGKPVFALHLGTDGDGGYVEVYDAKGKGVVSGRMVGERFAGPDAYFGLSRHAEGLTWELPTVEGYSEDPDRAAHGQILSTWRPDATVSEGRIEHDRIGVTQFHAPGLGAEQAEIARYVVELMFPRTFTHRRMGSEALDLAGQGTIRVGRHTDPRDGQSYLVGDYVDVDDDSHTFYFQRDPQGLLKPVRDQYNN